MNIILKLARKELQVLFYSPVAWIMLVLLVLQTAFAFVGKYESFLQINEFEDGVVHYPVSMMLFSMRGMWGSVVGYLYYAIPLLTMGLVSRELSSGSIKLLYSSPLTNAQIILGKFIAMVFYALVICAILLIYVIVAGCTVQDFEWGMVLTGLLGLFLLTCTYAAVGIFISSLTTYQFVAAVGTFLVLTLLSYVGRWGQEYDFVRDITYWLSIGGRSMTFILGMICSEDLLYFPIVTALFLILTIIRLNSVRLKIPFTTTLYKNLGVILIACLLGYLSSRPKLMAYYDASSTKINTLTEQSQEIVSKLDGGLTITGYANVLSGQYGQVAYPRFIQKNRELFKLYERFKPETRLKVVYYYDSITVAEGEGAAAYFARGGAAGKSLWERVRFVCGRSKLDSTILKSPEKIRQEIDLTGERTFVWNVKRENGDSTWLRVYNDMNVFPGESEISAALKRLAMDTPRIGFVTGHGMRSVSDYSAKGYSQFSTTKSFRESLLNQGFDVVEVGMTAPIPEDVDILVLADWRESFTAAEQTVLHDYIARGGNLFVLCEPRRREIANPWLRDEFGVELAEGTLVQYNRPDLTPDILCGVFTTEAKELSRYFGSYVVLPTAGGIERREEKGFRFVPVLRTDSLSAGQDGRRSAPVWNERESLDYAEADLVCRPEAGEIAKEYYPAVALTREQNGREQRVVIVGDADGIANGELGQQRSSINYQLITGTFNYLSENEMPVEISRPDFTDKHVFIERTGYNVMYGFFVIALPLLLLGTGGFLWFRRRGF